MSQRIETYIAARVARADAEQEVEVLVNRLRDYAKPLIDDWQQCREAVMERSLLTRLSEKLFGNNIPTPQDLRSAMVEFFEADAEALQTWSRLSDDEQRHVVPPEQKKFTDAFDGKVMAMRAREAR